MTHLVLIRGVPGSGKTTLAQSSFPTHQHFEADMFFVRDGVYCWDQTKIAFAHQWCLESARAALIEGKDVVVSNTFTRVKEIAPYIRLAKEILGTRVTIRTATGNFQNVHGVPAETVEKMRARFAAIPDGEVDLEKFE